PAYDLVKAFPNPYDRTVSLDIQSGLGRLGQMRVYSASGQALIGQDYFLEAGGNGFELEGSQNLGPGLHILQLVFPSGRVAHLRLIRIE
ncbi:MAG: T9SS type A sorting domain-containing protein, partial [Saprospirales bacterium]|nr:T9SS type A sorting domain-containing protein [Saprospirales bacterium]